MQIAVTGASGFLGRSVIRDAIRRGHEVIAFSRNPSRVVRDSIETRLFSIDDPPDLTGCEAVVHLAGESIAGWWSRQKKERIRSSRVLGTRRIVQAIKTTPEPPEVMVSASAMGYYGDSGESEITEESPPGSGFLSEVCQAWESEARLAEETCRVVRMRFGLVLGTGGGALPSMARAFRFGLGGPLGSGKQWWPWIHVEDAAALIVFVVENLDARGALNATAPWPVRNREFAKQLARVLRRPGVLRAPAFALKLLLREFAQELLNSRRVVPAYAAELDFPFRYPELEPALRELLR